MKEKKIKEKPVRRTMIGGQALMEGVMMRGPKSMAMAVRTEDGEILTHSERLKKPGWYRKVPIVRGCVSFVSSLVSGTGSLLKSAEVAFNEEETPGKGWFALSAVLGVLLAVGLFIALPSFIASMLDKYVFYPHVFKIAADATLPPSAVLVSALIEGVIRIALFILYLFLVSLMKDIRRTFMYHGAEHRTINCYEKGLDLTVKNVQSCSTRHNRCGTTFLFFVMMISILVFALTNWIFALLGFNFAEMTGGAFIRVGIRIALLPLVAGLSFELLRLLAILPDNVFVNILRAPGLALQRLTTYPPDDEMAEVAIKSFMLVEALEADPTCPTRDFGEVTIPEMRAVVLEKLTAAGVTEEAEAEWIIAAALQKKRSKFHEVERLNLAQYKRVMTLTNKRVTGVPLDYITGFTEFYGYKLKVSDAVLLPRMETEQVVETAVKELEGKDGLAALDLMTGSGCIAHVLAKKTTARVTASDISPAALDIARHNLKDLFVEVIESDCFENLAGRSFDLIISNPPYIKSAEIEGLQKEVKAQPKTALDGGEDGLDFYRRIASDAPAHLNAGGKLVLEIGHDQGEAVSGILSENFTNIRVLPDLSGSDRTVVAEKKINGTESI